MSYDCFGEEVYNFATPSSDDEHPAGGSSDLSSEASWDNPMEQLNSLADENEGMGNK